MFAPIENFIHLIFPRYCAGCEVPLAFKEQVICLYCLAKLPRAKIHDDRDNKIERLFWGRCDVYAATAFLRMSRKGLTHRLVHELKYENNPYVGTRLGKLFGDELNQLPLWRSVDAIIPVPLHPKKEALRGYNQSFEIAMGIGEVLKRPVHRHGLIRNIYTETQTKKSRMSRWENVEAIFKFNEYQLTKASHILLVDDVITTGSTIEACVHTLKQYSTAKISIASLAMPVR